MRPPLTYVFTPLVHCPWGQMQLTLVTRAEGFFDAQRNVIKELKEWKRSQIEMQRNDFPWLDEAITHMEDIQGVGSTIGMYADAEDKTLVLWYDEREP
jgi:hypothetical protein